MSEINSFVETLGGKPVLVYGLGRSGFSVAKALHDAGANVLACDDNIDNIAAAKDVGIGDLDLATFDFSTAAFLVLSPGVPFTHPSPHDVVSAAQKADVEILGDIELFHRVYPHVKTIGITGTNGKSTTTALVSHILSEGGETVLLGGNIGTPVFDLDMSKTPDWIVLEMSSFQIDLCPVFRPDIAAILNITPDHLDRHGSMENYVAVKERLLEPQENLGPFSKGAIAVVCTDDSYTEKIYERAIEKDERTVIQVSTKNEIVQGVYVGDDVLFDVLEPYAINIGDLSNVYVLRSIHSYQNTATAYAIAREAGMEHDKIWAAIKSFPGLNHRQYVVRNINGVNYVNDSKATNAASTATALGCRSHVYWIVGGRKKKNGLEGLEEFFKHIQHAFLIGESTEEFAKWLDNYGVEYTRCHTLDRAVEESHQMAQKNRGQPGGAGVVLLSPACASFDQFTSFEDRGDQFAALVNALEEK